MAEREKTGASGVGQGINNVHLLRSDVISYQIIKLSIALNAIIFHAKT
jgi:hypothetical protein